MHSKLIYPIPYLTVLVICLMLATGCKKTETPDPDLAAKVMGKYTVTTITTVVTPGSGQPISVTNGTVVLVRNGTSMNMVDLTLSYATASTSGSSTFSETKTISLQANGSAVDLYSGSTKIGIWTTTLLTFTGYPFNNSSVSFTATKQ